MDDHKNIAPDCFVFLLSKAYQKGHGLVKKRLKPYGLTNIQYVVLEVIWQTDGLTANELGNLLVIDKATLSGVLDRMSEGGWITKKRDDKDKRAIRLHATQKSSDLKDRLVNERKQANEELLDNFSSEDRMQLRRLLLNIV